MRANGSDGRWLLAAALGPVVLSTGGCLQPECTNPDYAHPECRVVSENQLARRRVASGAEVRCQDPEATSTITWDALGLVTEPGAGQVQVRVAAPGRFAISIDPPTDGSHRLEVTLDNVDPEAVVAVGPNGEERPLPQPRTRGLQRSFTVEFDDARPVWIGAIAPARSASASR